MRKWKILAIFLIAVSIVWFLLGFSFIAYSLATGIDFLFGWIILFWAPCSLTWYISYRCLKKSKVQIEGVPTSREDRPLPQEVDKNYGRVETKEKGTLFVFTRSVRFLLGIVMGTLTRLVMAEFLAGVMMNFAAYLAGGGEYLISLLILLLHLLVPGIVAGVITKGAKAGAVAGCLAGVISAALRQISIESTILVVIVLMIGGYLGGKIITESPPPPPSTVPGYQKTKGTIIERKDIEQKVPKTRSLWKAVLVVLIAFSLFIPFIIYLGSINGHPSISAEVTGPAEVQLGDQFTFNVTVTNTGDRDLCNVSVSDSYGFAWTGRLAIKESKTFSLEYKGPITDDIFNEVHAEGYTEEGDRVFDFDSLTLHTIPSTYTLTDAIIEELVGAELRGTGYCSGDCIKLKIIPKHNLTIDVEITPGLILINSGSGQNMIIAEVRIITVEPEIELDLDIEAYCLDLHKDAPSSREPLSIQTDPGTYGENVVKLMKSLENAPADQKSIRAIQIALWVITDDVPKEDIRINHSAEDIEDARWLLENAEIDISGKRLFGGGEEGYDGVYFPLGNKSFADEVVDFKIGEDTVAPYNNPQSAIGPPDYIDGKKNYVALGHEGILTVKFTDNYLTDVDGPDLYVFEIGPKIEPFKVEISKDGSNWIDLGTIRAGQPVSLDIHGKVAPGDKFRYVKITDANSHMSGSPYAGADIDAVGAIGIEQG